MRRLHNIHHNNSSRVVNKNTEEVYTQKIQTHIVSDRGVCFFSVLTYSPTSSRQSSTEESYVAFADPLVGFFSTSKGAKAMPNPRFFFQADEQLLNDLRQPEESYDGLDRRMASTEMEPVQ